MSSSGDEIHLLRALKGLSCYELVWLLFTTNNWTISSSWNLHMPIYVFLPNYKKEKIILDLSLIQFVLLAVDFSFIFDLLTPSCETLRAASFDCTEKCVLVEFIQIYYTRFQLTSKKIGKHLNSELEITWCPRSFTSPLHPQARGNKSSWERGTTRNNRNVRWHHGNGLEHHPNKLR